MPSQTSFERTSPQLAFNRALKGIRGQSYTPAVDSLEAVGGRCVWVTADGQRRCALGHAANMTLDARWSELDELYVDLELAMGRAESLVFTRRLRLHHDELPRRSVVEVADRQAWEAQMQRLAEEYGLAYAPPSSSDV